MNFELKKRKDAAILGDVAKELREIVEHQANMASLWPFDKCHLSEALLVAALRHLHAVIEGDKKIAEIMKNRYWDLESEL